MLLLDFGERQVHQGMHNIDLPFDVTLMEFIVPNSAIREINIKEVHNDVGSEKEDHHGKGENY